MKTLIVQCTLFLSILFCLLLLTYGQAQAETETEAESFNCKPINGSWDNIIVSLINWDRNSGVVKIAGKWHSANYSVDGFERRWGYGELKENGAYPYAIFMKLDGETYFYDFRKADTASQTMKAQCRETK
jgi:hypothetical protein